MKFPLGHYYSPIPSVSHINRNRANIFADRTPESLLEIDMNVEHQLSFVEILKQHLSELPLFQDEPTRQYRFGHNNHFYAYIDATLYALMLLHFKPRRVVEVGSGHSTHMALDINEHCLQNSIKLTCIEPYPERLKAHLKPDDQLTILESPVEYSAFEPFEELEANDILFIDSSHVSRVGSDVNYLFFEVLPRLQSGVFIHIHDIFYPFEYPEHWIDEGRAWNEDYLVRAFLQNNQRYPIQIFTNFLLKKCPQVFQGNPNWGPGNIGARASLWLKKTD
jgi:hypothetical protein